MAGKDSADPFFPADPFGLIETADGSYAVETVQDLPPTLAVDSYPIPQPSQFPPTAPTAARGPQPPPNANQQYNRQAYRQPFEAYRPLATPLPWPAQPARTPKRRRPLIVTIGLVVMTVVVSTNLVNAFIHNSVPAEEWTPIYGPAEVPGLVTLNFAINADEDWQEGLLLDSDTIATSYSQMVGSRDVLGGEATLLGFDPARDIAIFNIDDDNDWSPAEINTEADEDSELYVACADQSESYPISVTDFDATANSDFSHDGSNTPVKAWELSSNVKAGCVIATEYGETVAMVIGPYHSYYAIPISAVVDAADNLRSEVEEPDTLHIGRAGYLGLDLNAMLPGQPGALVTEVAEDGPAMRAGIKADDSLLSIDDKLLKVRQDADNAIRLLKPGSEVKLTWVTSKGKQRTATVTVEESEVT